MIVVVVVVVTVVTVVVTAVVIAIIVAYNLWQPTSTKPIKCETLIGLSVKPKCMKLSSHSLYF